MPPIDGLQDIWPRVSMLWVSSSVRQPMRALRKRGLGAGVAAADDDYVKFFNGLRHDLACSGRE